MEDALALGHGFIKSLLHFNENHVSLILAEGVNDGLTVLALPL